APIAPHQRRRPFLTGRLKFGLKASHPRAIYGLPPPINDAQDVNFGGGWAGSCMRAASDWQIGQNDPFGSLANGLLQLCMQPDLSHLLNARDCPPGLAADSWFFAGAWPMPGGAKLWRLLPSHKLLARRPLPGGRKCGPGLSPVQKPSSSGCELACAWRQGGNSVLPDLDRFAVARGGDVTLASCTGLFARDEARSFRLACNLFRWHVPGRKVLTQKIVHHSLR
ncbi:hypothetical protein MAPG_01774, partial [Magnaporthiopsis poae ATCC 64411]